VVIGMSTPSSDPARRFDFDAFYRGDIGVESHWPLGSRADLARWLAQAQRR
jgi:hypothetical protein